MKTCIVLEMKLEDGEYYPLETYKVLEPTDHLVNVDDFVVFALDKTSSFSILYGVVLSVSDAIIGTDVLTENEGVVLRKVCRSSDLGIKPQA